MIERLQRALKHVDELPPELQEEIAQIIEDNTEPLEPAPSTVEQPDYAHLPPSVRAALAVSGAWADMQDDDEFAALDRIRHESKPTPPIELDDL
ncbi:MAG TPA: hypothetical protein VFU88_09885 [Ktedonobacterales bacterium]|nr:hypothetical protein [Ktedonobacterales bacterium]